MNRLREQRSILAADTDKKLCLAPALLIAILTSCSVQPDAISSLTQSEPIGEAATVVLSPMSSDAWKAEFSWTTPVTQLDFVRHSDKRRPDRLSVLDDNFELFSTDNGDAIRRRDGNTFTYVAIVEPTSIENPPSGYLPFARFGDGGLLLHTGRFHACAGPCPSENGTDKGPWSFTIDGTKDLRTLVNGTLQFGRASFVDAGDGTKVYIGDGEITQGSNLVAVIDKALPDNVTNQLNQLFPPLMDYFGKHLGALTETQTLFASYNFPGDVEGYSIKGGALPRQVFMHFEGKELPEFSGDADFPHFLSWFFAHEAAHLYQRALPTNYDKAESWIHEGAADAFAYLSLQDLDAAPSAYLTKRLDRARETCARVLADGPLNTILERLQPFQTFYDCGILIHLAVHAAASRRSDSNLFNVWTNFTTRVAQGTPWNTNTYLAVVKDIAGEDIADLVESVVTQRLEDPAQTLAQLDAKAEHLP